VPEIVRAQIPSAYAGSGARVIRKGLVAELPKIRKGSVVFGQEYVKGWWCDT